MLQITSDWYLVLSCSQLRAKQKAMSLNLPHGQGSLQMDYIFLADFDVQAFRLNCPNAAITEIQRHKKMTHSQHSAGKYRIT